MRDRWDGALTWLHIRSLILWLDLRSILLELAWARIFRDRDAMLWHLIELGRAHGDRGELDAAEKAFVEARRIAESRGNDVGISRTAIGLGEIAIRRQDWDLAVR